MKYIVIAAQVGAPGNKILNHGTVIDENLYGPVKSKELVLAGFLEAVEEAEIKPAKKTSKAKDDLIDESENLQAK